MEKKKPLRLWYDEPAASWMKEALPIGNGYMGAMVFGGVTAETVQFNEKTLWIGGPGSAGYNYGISRENRQISHAAVRELQKELKDGALWLPIEVYSEKGVYGEETGFGNYQNFGQLTFTFDDALKEYTDYSRWLDLRTGTAGVSFVSGGVTYEREYFANYPDNVIAMRFTASGKRAVSFALGMVSAQGGITVASVAKDGTGVLSLAGTVADNGMKYESAVRVIAENGAVTVADNKVRVDNADSVVILLTAGTDYKNDYPTYRGEDPHAAVVARIETARQKGYDALREAHLKDYQEIFSRVELDLDHDPEVGVTTDELLKKHGEGVYDDQALEVLMFQYGRYLLLSSSRNGSLPANLQGVWNNSNTPAWNGDYHFNINVQMNYWPAYVTNMVETAYPLVDYMDSLREPGRVGAEVFFGVKSEPGEENGWTVHTMNNPFGVTGVNWGIWGWNPAGGAWMADQLWEQYTFTMDEEYLRSTIYPIMREAALFWTQTLVESSDGRLVSSPSYSAEQGALTEGTTYDQAIIWQLYTDVIEASEILGVDEELRETLLQQRERLQPLHINSKGMIKEWFEEDEPGMFDYDKHHRHVAHLVSLYPLRMFTPDMTEYYEAAKATLNERGDEGTGWARVFKMAHWSRLQDGDRAYALFVSTLERSTIDTILYDRGGGTYDNLWCSHPPFTQDGNAAASAAIAEMLVQSYNGAIEPLAAMPNAWGSGSYKGLVARGNFETDAAWSDGNLTSFTLRSGSGVDCVVSYPAIGEATVTCDGKPVAVTVSNDGNTISFPTTKGAEYVITNIPGAPEG